MNKFVCYRKNKSPSHGYGNMQSKRKVRELYLQINMDSQIVADLLTQIKEGPYYICVVCNRCLYKKSVISFKIENYGDGNAVSFSLVMSYDGHSYICRTCGKTMKNNCIPCQAVCNKMGITFSSKNFESISRFERVLVSRRILFKKVAIMPKSKLPKIKGSLCNIPVNKVCDNCKSFPRPADSNGLLIVKLERKVEYRSHVLFEPVRPLFKVKLKFFKLKFLKHHNHVYSDMQINMENCPSNVLDFNNNKLNNNGASSNKGSSSNSSDSCSRGTDSIFSELLRCHDEPINVTLETAEEQDVLDDPLPKFKAVSDETTVISEIQSATDIEKAFIVTPGEGKQPRTLLSDEFCEELAHPHLFPTGTFGYKAERDIQISPSKYFNQRLLNYSQKFASDSDYIVFAHSVLQTLQLNSQIHIAVRKVACSTLTAGVFSKKFKKVQFIARDKAYSFMNAIKGTSAYWKKFLHEVLAMVKQLGIPTFFLTLSCADLRWNELISIISKLNGLNISEEDIDEMSYHERCDTLNKNLVLVITHFQYRVELIFKQLYLVVLLGKKIIMRFV